MDASTIFMTVDVNTQEMRLQKIMDKTNQNMVFSLTIVAVVAILSMMVCSLAALGYNSRISMEKEKIEVDTTSNFNQK